MAWNQVEVLEQRAEFAVRALRGEPMSELCREYGISRPTGYLWKQRFGEHGVAGLKELSRRPSYSPAQTWSAVEQRIVQLRRMRPDWGARKLAVLVAGEGYKLPRITVHRVLLRHGLVPDADRRTPATQRFERTRANELWQMDFKGQKENPAAIGPLSVLDDHSRYAVALEQTGTTRGEAVRERLEGVFACNGLPEAMLMDHGIPWWSASAPGGWTRFLVWLMKQGIRCHFCAIRHPETQGPKPRARWSAFTSLWNELVRAAASKQCGWNRAGWTIFVTSTTTCGRTKRWGCKPRLAAGRPAGSSISPTRLAGITEQAARCGA